MMARASATRRSPKMTMALRASRVQADMSLSAALRRLAFDRRVVWIGSPSTEAQRPLASVASEFRVIETLPLGPLPHREASVDLLVIPEAEAFAQDVGSRLNELARLVDVGGLLVAGLAESTYADVYAALAGRFAEVRVFGQAPFSGWALGELAREPDDVMVDGSLIGEEPTPPVRLLALCSDAAIALESYAVVALPTEADLLVIPPPAHVGATSPLEVPTIPAPAETEPDGLEAGPSWNPSADADALESALAQASRRADALAREVERRGALLRDAIAHFAEATNAAPADVEGVVEEVSRARDRAVERALDAEAARAEALFRIDELEALLASVEVTEATEAGSQAPAMHEAPHVVVEDFERQLAELAGTVRGLRSRLAEVEEMRALTEARYRLGREDLEDAKAQKLELERTLAEMREQFELELIRSRGRTPIEAEVVDRGKLEEAERALAEARTEAEAREAGLQGELARRDAERQGLLHRLADREAAIETYRARREDRALETLGRELEELRASLEGRDRLVGRLQLDLAEAEASTRDAEGRLRRLTDENERLRQALLDASTSGDDRTALEERARALASLLETQKARLASAVSGRNEARSTLHDVRQLLAGLDLSSEVGDGCANRTHATALESSEEVLPRPTENRLALLEQEARDRELMLRSLSAQLEERNDRIRALERELEAMPGGRGADVEALQTELMQSQERAARLSEELEHARESLRLANLERASAASSEELAEARAELDRRASEIDRMRTRTMSFERDVRALRQVCSETRHALEELLGSAAASGDPAMAERIGSMLRMLDRV